MHFSVNPNSIIDSVCTHEERRVQKKGAPSWRCRVLSLWTKTPRPTPIPWSTLRNDSTVEAITCLGATKSSPDADLGAFAHFRRDGLSSGDKKPNVLGAVLMLWDDYSVSSIKWDSPKGLNIRCLLRHTRLTTPCHEPMNCTKRQCFFYAIPQQRPPTNVSLKDQAGRQLWKQMSNITICSVYIYSNIIPNVLARHLLMWL